MIGGWNGGGCGQCTALFGVTGFSIALVCSGVPKDQQVREGLIKLWHSKMGRRLSLGRSIGGVECRGQHRCCEHRRELQELPGPWNVPQGDQHPAIFAS